jgi:hypothetical protein
MIQFGEIDLPMIASAKICSLFAAALLAAALAGCSASGPGGEDSMAKFFVAPDGFVLFNCDQLAVKAAQLATREKELQGLMAQAGTGSDGRLVSAFAYRPEYITLRGDMTEVRKAAAAKNCKPAPALGNAPPRMSDTIVR